MTIPVWTNVFIVIKEGAHQYYLLKVEQSGLNVYCIPPHLGMHYSVHESGQAHFQPEGKVAEPEDSPPVVLQDGEAGAPIGDGIRRVPLGDLGRATGIFTAIYPIKSLSTDFLSFTRSRIECFVIDVDLFPKDTSLVQVGIWAVPKRNQLSFETNNPNIPADLLYKVVQGDPQIWIYARPFA